MNKIKIEDNFGKKLTLKKYIRERGEELSENFISRKKIIELKILNSNQIEKFVKSGKLHKIRFKNLVYFDKEEIQMLLKRS